MTMRLGEPDTVIAAPLTRSEMDVHVLGLGSSAHPYGQVWELQRTLQSEIHEGRRRNTLLLLEHAEVFTAGSRTQPQDRPPKSIPIPVLEVDRGGRITWHGPGQLVGYPIMRLPHRLDVVAYVRAIESWLIETCSALGVLTQRVEGRSGVWVDERDEREDPGNPIPRKIAAIGIRVARGVTMHGFALNCDCRLDWAQQIVPCGLSDAGVTSLSEERSRPVSTTMAASALIRSAGAAGATGAADEVEQTD